MRVRDLDGAGIPRAYLQRLCDRGVLEHLDRGLYRLVEAAATEQSSLAEVAKRVPHAIVCLLSALQVHGLTTESPHAVWVIIDRRARMPKVAYPKLEVVFPLVSCGEERREPLSSVDPVPSVGPLSH